MAKGVYWLTIEPTELHSQKAALLGENGFEVTFFKTLDSLLKELQSTRVPVIVVGDEGPEVSVAKAISTLGTMPEIQGARLILSTLRNSLTTLRAATCEGFRDIFNLDMDDELWIERFIFSTSGKYNRLPTKPPPENTSLPSSLSIPARVVWMNREHLMIESKACSHPGKKLNLTGPLAQSIGCKSIDLEVVSSLKDDLLYRFSEGFKATWSVPNEDENLINETLTVIKNLDIGKRCKIFLAIQSPALRAAIIKYFDPRFFEVLTALQKKSMVEEPKYFSPNLVFIEDRLCSNDMVDRFEAMIANTPKNCTVIVVGGREDLSGLKNFAAGRKLVALKRIPKNLVDIIEKEYIAEAFLSEQKESKQKYIPADHEFSLAEIKVPTTITGIENSSIHLHLPYVIGNYGLGRLHSKEIKDYFKKDIFVKISSRTPEVFDSDSDTPCKITCQICNINEEERLNIGDFIKTPQEAPTQKNSTTENEIPIKDKAVEEPSDTKNIQSETVTKHDRKTNWGWVVAAILGACTLISISVVLWLINR